MQKVSHWLENTGQKTSKLSGQALQMYARELEDQQRQANMHSPANGSTWVPYHGMAGESRHTQRLNHADHMPPVDVDHDATNGRVVELQEDGDSKSERTSERSPRRRVRRKRSSAKMTAGADESDTSAKCPRLDNDPHAQPRLQQVGSGSTLQTNGTQANPINVEPVPPKLIDFDEEPAKLIDIDDEPAKLIDVDEKPTKSNRGTATQELLEVATGKASRFSVAAQRVLDDLHASMNKLSSGMNHTRESLYSLWDEDKTLQAPSLKPHLKKLDQHLEAAVDELKIASELFDQLPTLETNREDECDYLDDLAAAEAELQAGVDERLRELDLLSGQARP